MSEHDEPSTVECLVAEARIWLQTADNNTALGDVQNACADLIEAVRCLADALMMHVQAQERG